MGTFDVRSLFTNIPVDLKINLTQKNIFTNGVKDFDELSNLQQKSYGTALDHQRDYFSISSRTL